MIARSWRRLTSWMGKWLRFKIDFKCKERLQGRRKPTRNKTGKHKHKTEIANKNTYSNTRTDKRAGRRSYDCAQLEETDKLDGQVVKI